MGNVAGASAKCYWRNSNEFTKKEREEEISRFEVHGGKGLVRTGDIFVVAGDLLAVQQQRERVAACIRLRDFTDLECVVHEVVVEDLM